MGPEARWIKLTDKAAYNFRQYTLLHVQAQRYISWKMRVYVEQLQSLFGETSIKLLYHSSIFERLDTKIPHLDMLFAILNSYLQDTLKKAKLYNKFGQEIRIRFLSVTTHFQNNPNKKLLFKFGERVRGRMVHRTEENYRALFRTLNEKIKRDFTTLKHS